MDIEASVRGRSLVIGVFGSESRVSRAGGAETLVDRIRRTLHSCEHNETSSTSEACDAGV